ncbi:MAG: PSD1 and planctomycete cytochrome C domain-containing protein, partial [bacterium]|nr:PSD1 and planctomycete cytochrome C domain-containing protein [bacterium]
MHLSPPVLLMITKISAHLFALLVASLLLGSSLLGQEVAADAEGADSPATKAASTWSEVTEAEKLFALTVAPALEAKCFACHGQEADAIESGLVLTSLKATLEGGDSGESVLVPGDRQASWLYLSATWQHDELQMPPKENDRFDAKTLEALGTWIDLGAPWPSAARQQEIREQFSAGLTVPTSGGLNASWDQRRYEPKTLWAYQPLNKTGSPTADGSADNPIDAFLNAKLDELGIEAAGRADRRTLARRLFFDLTGLPPTPQQVRAFVEDPEPDELAWERLVDRLLASPRFGEQWARHWLDTVRYADSAGFANDYQRPNAWRYRDYVIRAINQDRPLSDFIREQIAGDELDPHDPEMLIAVGMLRMGPWEQTGMSIDKVTRQQFLDDVTDVIGQAFLAHPLQCARCHDHKFDPIPTRDYYRIQAVFSTTQFADRDAAFLSSENQSDFEQQTHYLQQRIAFFEGVIQELKEKETKASREWYAERGLQYATRDKKLKQGVPEELIAPKNTGFTAADFGLERIARKYLQRHRWELDRFRAIALSTYSGPTPKRNSVQDRIEMPANLEASGKLEQTSILSGGDIFSPTIPVSPGVLSVLTGVLSHDQVLEKSSLTTDTIGRRTEFAHWLVDAARNPLTPRVLVNRIWQHHFGQGIVKTPNNFGTAASQPTHPALLDFLATELVDSKWSAKTLHRLILLSDAYCRAEDYAQPQQREQLKEKDPLGTSYAVFQARRLSAEEIRDSQLAISGLLNLESGGPPVRPNLNPEVAVQPRQIMGTYAPIYQASPLPADRNRRTIYALRLRGLRDPMLEVFNQPSPDLPCEQRDISTVAPQALTLFNSSFSFDRALAMAERLLHEGQQYGLDDKGVVTRAFELVYSRLPDAQELKQCLEHWQLMAARHEHINLPDSLPPVEFTRSFVDENTG